MYSNVLASDWLLMMRAMLNALLLLAWRPLLQVKLARLSEPNRAKSLNLERQLPDVSYSQRLEGSKKNNKRLKI